jgi:hypothetical protein
VPEARRRELPERSSWFICTPAAGSPKACPTPRAGYRQATKRSERGVRLGCAAEQGRGNRRTDRSHYSGKSPPCHGPDRPGSPGSAGFLPVRFRRSRADPNICTPQVSTLAKAIAGARPTRLSIGRRIWTSRVAASLWRRLLIITGEDIGPGWIESLVVIRALYETSAEGKGKLNWPGRLSS